MVSIPTIMSTTSSCQLPIMNQAVGIRKRVNSRVKTSAAKPSVFSGESGLRGCRSRVSVSAGASIWESRRRKVHWTVARARLALQNVKKLTAPEHFWKMRSAKSVQDCGESSVSHKNRCKLRLLNAL